MATETKLADGLELESTVEMPMPPASAAAGGADRLSTTDAWRVAPPLTDEQLEATDRTVPHYDRHSLERQVRALEEQLQIRDGQLAGLQRELEEREAQLRGLEGQLAGLREELIQSRAQLEQLQTRDTGRPAHLAVAPQRSVEASPQRLLVRTEGANGIVHVLGRRTTVGRTPDNDLRVEAGFVSRHHAALLLSGADTVVEDLHSTNGTFVNGEQIARRTLREGDVVAFGKIQYRFVIKPAG